MIRKIVETFKQAFEPALSGAWDGGAGTIERQNQAALVTHRHWYVWRLSDDRVRCEASYGPFSSRRDADECEYALREEVGDTFFVNDVPGVPARLS